MRDIGDYPASERRDLIRRWRKSRLTIRDTINWMGSKEIMRHFAHWTAGSALIMLLAVFVGVVAEEIFGLPLDTDPAIYNALPIILIGSPAAGLVMTIIGITISKLNLEETVSLYLRYEGKADTKWLGGDAE